MNTIPAQGIGAVGRISRNDCNFLWEFELMMNTRPDEIRDSAAHNGSPTSTAPQPSTLTSRNGRANTSLVQALWLNRSRAGREKLDDFKKIGLNSGPDSGTALLTCSKLAHERHWDVSV